MKPAFDHLDLGNDVRRLIALAVGESPRVLLAPLDKGLSGAEVWRARWELPASSALSALHVFKIGQHEKLAREASAIRSVAAAIDPDMTYVELFADPDTGLGLLRQYFGGGSPGHVSSLRMHIRGCSSADAAVRCIDELYLDRMARWHAQEFPSRTVDSTYGAELDWWMARADVRATAERIGFRAIQHSLNARLSLDLEAIVNFVTELAVENGSFAIGPVHGDLHAQNVLVSEGGRLHLIDYGWCSERWRAVDFIMLECSLKFLVTPRHAQLDDLLQLERELDDSVDGSDHLPAFFDGELRKILDCVSRVRRLALQLNAVESQEQYLRGLALLTAGLTSVPGKVNHPYMVHSLGFLRRRLERGW